MAPGNEVRKCKIVSERMLSKLSFNDSGRPIFITYSICPPVTVRVVLTRNITTEVDNLVFVVIIIIVPLYCRLCMWDNSWLDCSGHIRPSFLDTLFPVP